MNKESFIRKLEQCLKHIPKEDRAVRYYTKYFDDMNVDENHDITSELGNPANIANCTEKHIDTPKSTTLAVLLRFVLNKRPLDV